MPLCAACAHADASKRSWRASKHNKSIRKEDYVPGNDTSCDHLISHEPGLIPQVTGHFIKTKDQIADLFFTKALSEIQFLVLHKVLMGW